MKPQDKEAREEKENRAYRRCRARRSETSTDEEAKAAVAAQKEERKQERDAEQGLSCDALLEKRREKRAQKDMNDKSAKDTMNNIKQIFDPEFRHAIDEAMKSKKGRDQVIRDQEDRDGQELDDRVQSAQDELDEDDVSGRDEVREQVCKSWFADKKDSEDLMDDVVEDLCEMSEEEFQHAKDILKVKGDKSDKTTEGEPVENTEGEPSEKPTVERPAAQVPRGTEDAVEKTTDGDN